MHQIQINIDSKPHLVVEMHAVPRIGEVLRFGTSPFPAGRHLVVLGVTHVLMSTTTESPNWIHRQIGIMLSCKEQLDPPTMRDLFWRNLRDRFTGKGGSDASEANV